FSFVVIVPSTEHRGQKACRMEPQGLQWSVPKYEVPSFPTTNPGATREKVRFTKLSSLTADLIVYAVPSSFSFSAKLSAPKQNISSSKSWLYKESECQIWGASPLGEKILQLNWLVMWRPAMLL